MAEQVPVPEWIHVGARLAILSGRHDPRSVRYVTVEKVTATQVVLDGENGRFALKDVADDGVALTRRVKDPWTPSDRLSSVDDPRVVAAVHSRRLARFMSDARHAFDQMEVKATPEAAREAIAAIEKWIELADNPPV